MRSIRISNAVWDEAEHHAHAEGISTTDLVDRLLRRYNTTRRRTRDSDPDTSGQQRQ